MNLYSSVVFLHVASATVLIGSSLSSPFVRGAVRRARSVAEVATLLDFARRATRANPVAAMVLLGTGLYLGSAGWWASGWFAVSVALFVFSVAWAVRTVEGELKRLGSALAASPEGPVPPVLDAARRSERLDLAADALLGADAAALFLMVNKPALPTAVAVAVLGVGVAMMQRLLRRRPEHVAALGVEKN